jgi:hypothetical protein
MKLRETFIVWLFDISTAPYAKYFKTGKDSWHMTAVDLLTYPKGSLGYEIGLFLTSNSFELMDRLETHDAYHVITEYGTDVPNEIAQQYFFFGNGKRTLYMLGVLFLNVFLLPEYFSRYVAAYRRGTSSRPLHLIDIKKSLNTPLQDIQNQIFNTSSYHCYSATVHSIDLFKI